MKILFIGDIFARPGRDVVKKLLPEIKEELKPDLVFANAENLTHGNGFIPEHIEEMKQAGIDYFTTGNHVWGNRNGMMELNNPNFPVIRPANYPQLPEVPGRGYQIIETGMMEKVLLVNLMGRVGIKKDFDCPFLTMDRILRETSHERFAAIIVDFHAEATSEKYALGLYLDGKVSAVFGTHTHVPTADLRILPGGTAFMGDLGMVGALNSVIGVKKDVIINSFLTQLPAKHEPESEGQMLFSGALVELDEKSQKALNVLHVHKII